VRGRVGGNGSSLGRAPHDDAAWPEVDRRGEGANLGVACVAESNDGGYRCRPT
jgi:hypothetical protein